MLFIWIFATQFYCTCLDQVRSILPALELLPFYCSVSSRGGATQIQYMIVFLKMYDFMHRRLLFFRVKTLITSRDTLQRVIGSYKHILTDSILTIFWEFIRIIISHFMLIRFLVGNDNFLTLEKLCSFLVVIFHWINCTGINWWLRTVFIKNIKYMIMPKEAKNAP